MNVLKNSRYAAHLEFEDSKKTSAAPCTSENYADPFELANGVTDKPSCCKKAKACC